MKLITKKQLTEVYMAGKRAGAREYRQLQGLERQNRHFCNTGCRTAKCVKAAPIEPIKEEQK